MKRKLLAGFLALVMAASPVFSAIPAVHAAAPHEVTATPGTSNTITIGNDLIERTFSTADGKLKTQQIVNKRTDNGNTVFTPAQGSEEFVIRVAKDSDTVVPLHPALDRTGWTATADSRQNASGANDGPAQNLLDGNVNSIWHSNYGGGIGDQDYPHNVVINMKKEVTFQCFSYTPRQQGENINGNILGYELWASTKESAEDLPLGDASWKKISSGNFKYDDINPIYVNLENPVTARQLKLVAVSSKNGQKFAGGAEFNLHETPYQFASKNDREFAASALTLAGDPVVSAASPTKGGKKLTFTFEPFEFKGVTYTITENIVMFDGDHFMRKFLEISVPEADRTKNPIDFIDLESMKVSQGDTTWTVPHVGGIVAMEEFKANLGQPIYIDGMFFGCEFPVTDTQIVDGMGRIRYYSGKTFDRMSKDNQLTEDGKLVTWQTVAGAARSTDMQVLQADFFAYISSISIPSEFRLQYNSWFDNMMLIDDASIWKSFIEVDRELNRVEMRPLDSYVADDGWNNYNDTHVVDAARSGTSLNGKGFWDFNTKFPKQFTPASELVQNFGSSFGTWVGPRGGYNFYGSLADILTKSGKGSKAGGSVDVADRVYVANFENMAKNFQRDFGINYWKWDGFADDAQYNHFPAKDGVPGYANRHMTGGYHNMYHVTDLWEAWTDLMDNTRDHAKGLKKPIEDLWISLTCYTNPSPWFLQWGNSVWLQCTADQRNASFGNSHLDKQMTYRDACYYDFLKNHQFQFPLSNLYNHDPVYGVEGTGMNMNTATDENFQNYLYMMSTRGNAFWELHYSDSIMTEGKYEVTSEFAAWAEANYHMLKNSKMFGGKPDVTHLDNFNSNQNEADAYGYACFDGTDGIISMRNPTVNGDKTISFTFDRTMGVKEDCGVLQYHVEHSYNAPDDLRTTGTLEYGKSYTMTLKPNEVLILRVSKDGDKTAPTITRAYTDGDQNVTVKFSEKVNGTDLAIAGKTVTVAKSADGLTYHLTVAEPMTNGETLNITATGIRDLANNELTANTISTVYYEDNLALSVGEGNVTGSKVLGQADLSDDGFTMQATVKNAQGAVLTHGDKAELGVQADGKAYFKLGKATAVSKVAVNDGAEHRITGVKENNGIIKIYVDGNLSSSAYDKENRYLALGNADVTLGNADFNGKTSAVVYAEGLGYDVIKNLGVTGGPLSPDGMTVTVSGTSEKKPENGDVKALLFDGNPETYWTSEKAESGIAKGSPNVTIELGGEYMMSGLDYTKRYHNGPDAYWKCTGNLRSYFVEVSMDGQHWTTVAEGDTFADEQLNEKGNGGTTEIRFTPVKAKYIRISGGTSYHWQQDNVNKFMAAGDLALYGNEIVLENLALNKTGLEAKHVDGSEVATSTDRPLSMAVDGTKDDTRFNYGEFGSDNDQAPAYFQVDLEKKYEISEIHLYRYWDDGRTYQNTVVAVADNAAFENPTILYNSDSGNRHGLGAGEDAAYAESAEGHVIAAPEGTQGRYVRVYMDGTATGGRTNHIVELEVMGREIQAATVNAIFKNGDTVVEVRPVEVGAALGALPTVTAPANKVLKGWQAADGSFATEATTIDKETTFTAVFGSEELTNRNVNFYAYVNGELTLMKNRTDVTTYWIDGRQCIDAETLESVYGVLGFEAADLTANSKLILHTDRGMGSMWAEPAKAADGKVYAASINHKSAEGDNIDLFYLPNQSVSSSISKTDAATVAAETFYTVTNGEEKQYFLTGADAVVTLNNAEGKKWVLTGADGTVVEGQVGETQTVFTVNGIAQAYTVSQEELPVDQLFEITGSAVGLKNNLTMLFNVNKAALKGRTDVKAVVTKAGVGVPDTVTEIPYDSNTWKETADGTHLHVEYAGLSAKEMNVELTVVICDEAGTALSYPYTTSIQDYAKKILHNPDESAMHKLIVDMLNYGAAAQQHFKYNVDNLANSILTEEEKALATKSAVPENDLAPVSNYVTTSLSLDSTILLNVYFKGFTRDMVTEVAVSYTDHYGNQKNAVYQAGELVESKSYQALGIAMDELAVADGRQLVKFQVKGTDGQILAEASDSMQGYAARVLESGKAPAELKALMESMMKFVDSAAEYFAK